jgi:hypothetical protein
MLFARRNGRHPGTTSREFNKSASSMKREVFEFAGVLELFFLLSANPFPYDLLPDEM